ncbi:MAG: type II secretion system protein [Campylobacterales bacterium]
MRRGFTMIELIFSLVIIAVVASVGTDVIRMVFERYVASRDLERGQSDVRRTLDLLASRLQYRIKNSAIGRNTGNNQIIAIDNLALNTNFEVLEWIGIAYESQRGMNKAGWTGYAIQTGENSLGDPGANFNTAALSIETELTSAIDPYGSRSVVLVFAGKDGRGSYTSDQNSSWGWHADDNLSSYFAVTPNTETNLTLTNLAPSNPTDFSEQYFLARSAYALWVDEGNLTLVYNYRPWLGETLADGTSTPLLENVTTFHFRESGGVLRLILCVSLPDGVMGDTVEYCRERSVL